MYDSSTLPLAPDCTEHTELTPEGYVLALDALAEQWPLVAAVPGFGGVVAPCPAFAPPSDDSATRLDHAVMMACGALTQNGADPHRWPFLGTLLQPVRRPTFGIYTMTRDAS